MAENCAGGTLSVFVPDQSKPWNEARVSHLYKRLGFGCNYQEIQAGLQKSPSQLVDDLVDAAKNAPLPAVPSWHNWSVFNYTNFNSQTLDQYIEWYLQWLNDMINTGVREKLALFWHNHFVTRFVDYNCTSYMYEYHKLLQQHAFGNFQTFLKEMAKTPAMLFFLDGRLNKKQLPNENYARELFELFTLGANIGYTQQDIEEASRALTGWTNVTVACGTINFNPSHFDNNSKTVFGQTANFDFDGIHDLIFQERAVEVSQFIAEKIYRHFVHTIPNPTIVDGLAQTFRNNNFEIEPVIKQLFKSDHFFEDEIISVNIKSPVEFLISFIREVDIPYDSTIMQSIVYLTYEMGQQLFNPIDVSGWNGNRSWINGTAMTVRWDVLTKYLGYVVLNVQYKERLRDFAKDVSGNSSDVEVVARKITDFLIPKGLDSATAYDSATIALKYQVPQNYFDSGQWNLNFQFVPEQVWNLLNWVVRRPEFQLT